MTFSPLLMVIMSPEAKLSPVDELVLADFERLAACVDLDQLSHRHIFMTGCTGFVGYWLLMAIYYLNQQGSEIRVTGISREPEAFYLRHPALAGLDWLKLHQADVTTFELQQDAFDYIIHAATDTRPIRLNAGNDMLGAAYQGTLRICRQAELSSVKAMLLVSSGAVYEKSQLPADAGKQAAGYNAYTLAKQIMEQVAISHAQQANYQLTIARCFAFIGYLLPEHLAISQFIRDARCFESIQIHGDGTPVRSYLYAADLAFWLLTILIKGQHCHAYDVGSDDARSIEEHAKLVRDLLAADKKLNKSVTDADAVGTRHQYIPDISRALEELGLDVWTDLETAVKQQAKMESLLK